AERWRARHAAPEMDLSGAVGDHFADKLELDQLELVVARDLRRERNIQGGDGAEDGGGGGARLHQRTHLQTRVLIAAHLEQQYQLRTRQADDPADPTIDDARCPVHTRLP